MISKSRNFDISAVKYQSTKNDKTIKKEGES